MNNRQNQIYEEYWSYTAAYTDLNGQLFLSVLNACIAFFDNRQDCQHCDGQDQYEALQQTVVSITKINQLSVRKAINQLVKLGFLKPLLQGYVAEAKDYVAAATDRKRQSILSKVVYSYCNFNNAMTKPDVAGQGQINFFLKTLEEVGSINDNALVALMAVNPNDYSNGFMNREELNRVFATMSENGFIDRKYNQIAHLKNLLGRLDDLQLHDGTIYFKTDARRLFGDGDDPKREVRDPYLQRIYKAELEEESRIHFNCETPKCMLEGLAHPVLIASHIKPYSHCKADAKAQFDVNNGLLLSKNTDSLFDLGYMTFAADGSIIPSSTLDGDMVRYLSQFRLHPEFMNPSRMDYMEYHRKHVFEARCASAKAKF